MRAVLLAGLVLLAITFAQENCEINLDHEEYKPSKEKCLQEFPLSSETIEEVKNGNDSPGDFDEKMRLRCFYKCMMKDFDLINAEDEYDGDKLTEFVNNKLGDKAAFTEKAATRIKDCYSIGGMSADSCERAFLAVRCHQYREQLKGCTIIGL